MRVRVRIGVGVRVRVRVRARVGISGEITAEALFALNQQRPLLSVEKRQPRDHLWRDRSRRWAGGGGESDGGVQSQVQLTRLRCCKGRSTGRLSCREPSRGRACAG